MGPSRVCFCSPGPRPCWLPATQPWAAVAASRASPRGGASTGCTRTHKPRISTTSPTPKQAFCGGSTLPFTLLSVISAQFRLLHEWEGVCMTAFGRKSLSRHRTGSKIKNRNSIFLTFLGRWAIRDANRHSFPEADPLLPCMAMPLAVFVLVLH